MQNARKNVWCFLACLGLCAPGCHRDDCSIGFVGDPGQPPQAVMLITDGQSHVLREVTAGGPVSLEPPPQGGYVLDAGARVRNVDGCGILMHGILRDLATGVQIGDDARTSQLVPAPGGWAQPDPSDNAYVANVPGCPDYAPKDVQGQPYQLEVDATDREGRVARAVLQVVPVCQFANPLLQQNCVCTCSANYTLGKCGAPAGDM